MTTRATTAALALALLLAPPPAEAQGRLPQAVSGLLGMRCGQATGLLERAGVTVEGARAPFIWDSGASRVGVRALLVGETGLELYCGASGRIVGFAAGREWGERLFDALLPSGLRPFMTSDEAEAAMGQPTISGFDGRRGDGGALWLRDGLFVSYSACLSC